MTAPTAASEVGASAPGASAAPGPEHQGVGRIEAVTEQSMTISHGAIPSAQWGAMTMEFGAPPAGMPKGFKPGDRIRFRFRLNRDGVATLSAVESAAAVSGAKP